MIYQDVINLLIFWGDSKCQMPITKKLPFNKLKTYQSTIEQERTIQMAKEFSDVEYAKIGLPRVYQLPDKTYLLADGNHRVNAAILAGRTEGDFTIIQLIQKKGVSPKPVPKPIVKPETIGKDIVSNAPSLKRIQKELAVVKASPEYKMYQSSANKLQKELDAKIKIRNAIKQEQNKLEDKLEDELNINYREFKKVPEYRSLEKKYWKAVADIGDVKRDLNGPVQQMTDMTKEVVLKGIIPPKGGTISVVYPTGKSTSLINNFKKAISKTEDLLHPSVLKKIPEIHLNHQSGIRAYYSKEMKGKGVTRPSGMYVGNADALTITHEFGHHIETTIPGLKARANAFLRKRAAGDPLTPIYKGTREMGWSDGFFSHYCGKFYASGATELVSMGLEQMGVIHMNFL